MEKSLAFNPAMNHWWDFGLFTLCRIKLSLFTGWAPRRGLCPWPGCTVMDGAGMNYLLAILDHLPSSELSLLILNLFISIPKCIKKVPMYMKFISLPSFLPLLPVHWWVTLEGWVSLGCKLSLKGCGDSVLAQGTVCPSWFWFFSSHLCAAFKAVEWKWLWFLSLSCMWHNPL